MRRRFKIDFAKSLITILVMGLSNPLAAGLGNVMQKRYHPQKMVIPGLIQDFLQMETLSSRWMTGR